MGSSYSPISRSGQGWAWRLFNLTQDRVKKKNGMLFEIPGPAWNDLPPEPCQKEGEGSHSVSMAFSCTSTQRAGTLPPKLVSMSGLAKAGLLAHAMRVTPTRAWLHAGGSHGEKGRKPHESEVLRWPGGVGDRGGRPSRATVRSDARKHGGQGARSRDERPTFTASVARTVARIVARIVGRRGR